MSAEPHATPASIRRAVRRAEQGKALSPTEAAALFAARGDVLEALMAVAADLRTLGHGDQITYSRKVFVPITMLCRDHCHYCTFAKPPAKLDAPYLLPDEIVDIARNGAQLGCKEALFTLGDKPEARYREAGQWLDARGYASTLDYVRAMAIQVIERTGLLPHLNPGVMSYDEMARLKHVAASMGLMLETSSGRLSEKGGPHFGSPDKDPIVRIRTLEDAGRLAIPFTTGMLVGIGETELERAETIFAIRDVHRRYGHIQEVIVQNFRAKPRTAMQHAVEPSDEEFIAAVAATRVLLGPRMHIQAPPNLSDVEQQRRLLRAGIDDWGGVSPLTPDHVNPERPWPSIEALAATTRSEGSRLRERLTIYPEFSARPDPFLAAKMRGPVDDLLGSDGLADPARLPSPQPWQDRDVAWKPRSTTLMFSKGPDAGTRADAPTIYGSFDEVGLTREWQERRIDWPRIDRDVASGLAKAEAGRSRSITDEEALAMLQADGASLDALCRTADAMRRHAVGDDVTFVVNRNINFTNVCYVGCRFCAFAQREVDVESYTLTLNEVADRAGEAWELGATEVCVQGGIHPDLPGTFYLDLLDAIRARVPQMHIHAFSPMEILSAAAKLGIDEREFLAECKSHGLGTIPGTAAEILDDDVRWALTKGKLPADTWERIVVTAHELGIRSSATMMYGHVDAPPHWVFHIRRLARIQAETGGFTEFVPLPFVHQNAPIYLAGRARPGPTPVDNLRVHAVARILLAGQIENIQVSWVKLGLDASKEILCAGANDFGGTLMEETISRMAGAEWGVAKSVEELERAIREIDRRPRERTTVYGAVQRSSAGT